MQRDLRRFPADANGDVLWRMAQAGDDLAKPREIDFSVLFAEEDAALRFALRALRHGLKVGLRKLDEAADSLEWDITASAVMPPSYKEIDDLERLLGEDASTLGGKLDGWGCMQVN